VPIGKVAVDRNLEGAQHGNIDVPAAHHRERIGVVEIGATGQQRHMLFTRVDQIIVFLAWRRARAHAQYTVFTVQEHFLVTQVVGYQRGYANTQVYVGSFENIVGHSLGHFATR
jgi:hypothetical protein